jgi:hypothetical protein
MVTRPERVLCDGGTATVDKGGGVDEIDQR